MVDTLVIAWVLLDQRAWYHYQAPTPQPAVGKVDRAMGLRPQEMPDDGEYGQLQFDAPVQSSD